MMKKSVLPIVILLLLGSWTAFAEDNDPSAAQAPPLEAKEKTKAPKPTLKIGARIHAGWDMEHTRSPQTSTDSTTGEVTTTYTESTENSFFVKRARLKLEWTPVDYLAAVLQIDAGAGIVAEFLKDAYIHISPMRQLELRVGQFKKPFSALELSSPSKRRAINRGPGNDLIVEDLMFGDRDLGVQISGRLIKSVKLDYEIGAFNGSGPSVADGGKSKDAVGRLSIRPFKPLTIGAGVSWKFFDLENFPEGKPDNAWASGLDARLKLGGFRLSLEALVGENHNAYSYASSDSEIDADNPPYFINATAVFSYKHNFPVSWKFALEPLVKGEFLEPDSVITEDEVIAITPGLNAYFGKYLRLMINGEIIRSRKNSQDVFPDSETLILLLCVDI